LKNGKGLDTKIIKVLPLNQPFSPSSSSPLKKTISHLNSFMDHHFSTKKQKKPRKFACDEKNKTLSLSVQLCLVRCDRKNPEPRFTRKQKKVRALSPQKKVQVWLFLSERKKKKRCVRMALLDGETNDLPTKIL